MSDKTNFVRNTISADSGIRHTNCKIYTPSGNLLCVNSVKRGLWYVNKTGAEILSKNKDGYPVEIKLTFEPKGFTDNGDTFRLTVQESKCVVSGESDITELTKHHIVPYCYRQYMPEEYKSRNHHDIVFLSQEGHCEYEAIVNKFKADLHKKYNIDTEAEASCQFNEKFKILRNNIFGKMRGYIRTIKHGKLPREKYNEFMQFISSHSENIVKENNIKTLDELYNFLIESFKRDKKELMESSNNVYKKLVDKLIELDELDNFIIMWRKHFIETMNPRYMPIGWDINNYTKNK